MNNRVSRCINDKGLPAGLEDLVDKKYLLFAAGVNTDNISAIHNFLDLAVFDGGAQQWIREVELLEDFARMVVEAKHLLTVRPDHQREGLSHAPATDQPDGFLCQFETAVSLWRRRGGVQFAAPGGEKIMPEKWKCEVCGYIHDGKDAPSACPKCGAAAERFALLDDTAAGLVERSRRTNALHCRVVDLARQIERACKEGIEDNLDPGCVRVFERSLAQCYEMMKTSMTEMQGHMAKGKWG